MLRVSYIRWDPDIHFAGWLVFSPTFVSQIQGIRSDAPRRRVRMDVTVSTTAGAKGVDVNNHRRRVGLAVFEPPKKQSKLFVHMLIF